ncbi:MAG: hypothetical protein K1Y36_04285 [Blastocatellia bacterium]|nr:hypothetical protein [Blastocatellia bacterium]
MKAFILCCFLFFSPLCAAETNASQCRLRVMDARELTVQADLIARVRVKKAKDIRDPLYGQIATLEVVEVIKGDPRLKEVTVWAMTKIYCATDAYVRGQEFLVFLAHEQTLYRTLNFQYGQFLIGGPTIKGWRTPNPDASAAPEKTYEQIKNEIQIYLEPLRPQGETPVPPQTGIPLVPKPETE